ncbi:MAG: hypothetical protein JXR48_01895 [Candidatus Delongbacteria bacterium]|nr:hypothetical protein [Candidatus Delongbacteria bacterium]
MKNKKALDGFTISELTVVLAITGVVVILSVFIYLNFKSYFNNMQSTNDYCNEVIRLKNSLSYKTFKSEYIISDGDKLSFIDYDGCVQTLNYNKEFIIITDSKLNISDTIKLKVQNLQVRKLDNSNLVDIITIMLQNELSTDLELVFTKQYDNKTMFDLTNLHGNKH